MCSGPFVQPCQRLVLQLRSPPSPSVVLLVIKLCLHTYLPLQARRLQYAYADRQLMNSLEVLIHTWCSRGMLCYATALQSDLCTSAQNSQCVANHAWLILVLQSIPCSV